jgi:hypothetical protein
MNRIVYIEIVGKEYPMSFSLMAAKKIAAKNGNVEKMLESVKNDGGTTPAVVDSLVDILELLISQGCAYKNYFEKDVPVKENDPVIDGKWTPLPREALEIAVSISELERIADKIAECINGSQKKEVEAKEIPSKGKEEAGQA